MTESGRALKIHCSFCNRTNKAGMRFCGHAARDSSRRKDKDKVAVTIGGSTVTG